MDAKMIENLGVTDPTKLVDMLDKMSRSKGYIEIRDNITPQMIKQIRIDKDLYQKFQDIKMECKKSYDYDNKTATMLEVNRGLTNLYGIVVNLVKASRNDTEEKLNAICTAINTIEVKLGIDPTDWDGGTNNVTDNTGDVEGITTSDHRTE